MKHAVSPWSAGVLAAMLVSSLAAAGCGSSGTDCTAAANNAVALIRADLTLEIAAAEGKPDAETKLKELRRREAMLTALKEEVVTTCKGEKWNAETRKCIANAKATAIFVECDPDKGLGLPPDSTEGAEETKTDTDEPADDTDEPAGDEATPTKVPAEPADSAKPSGIDDKPGAEPAAN